ncbi:MAG: flagellar assembly protein FliH [Polyangiaceae bacterium]|nr:flagellar assembly protein FliH [Polyangiaceae bacterium]
MTRARLLSGEEAAAARPIASFKGASAPANPAGIRHFAPAARRVLRERAHAMAEAERTLERARAQAAECFARAKEAAAGEIAAAALAARVEADAQGVARWLAVRREDQLRLARESDRIVSIAVAIAERLLGTALEIEPRRIAEIARVALAEAGGSRRAVIDAHPLDAAALKSGLRAGLGAAHAEIHLEVREDPTLNRGDLRLHTDLGPIDARLATRFDRLAGALRDVIAERGATEPSAHG